MPLNTIQRMMHIRSVHNQKVMHNVARLWDISRQAQSSQDILDGLHPWGKNNHLQFHNSLSYGFMVFALLSLPLGWIVVDYFPFSLSVLIAFGWAFLGYISYEADDPIDEVIDALELKMKLFKDQLNFNQLPSHLTGTMNSVIVLSKLKQYFPLFQQGNESNEIVRYASTVWHDAQGKPHPVLLFKYHYVSQLSIPNAEGKEQKIKQIEKDLWGAFVFQIEPLGIAASNRRDRFFYPYTQSWRSSDIQLNQNLKIFGYDQHQLARTIRPALTLKLSDFFQHNKGDLVIHFEENILCYLGEQNLFRTLSKKPRKDIQNISDLRGYLRTLDMPDYQLFKQRMLNLIQ